MFSFYATLRGNWSKYNFSFYPWKLIFNYSFFKYIWNEINIITISRYKMIRHISVFGVIFTILAVVLSQPQNGLFKVNFVFPLSFNSSFKVTCSNYKRSYLNKSINCNKTYNIWVLKHLRNSEVFFGSHMIWYDLLESTRISKDKNLEIWWSLRISKNLWRSLRIFEYL